MPTGNVRRSQVVYAGQCGSKLFSPQRHCLTCIVHNFAGTLCHVVTEGVPTLVVTSKSNSHSSTGDLGMEQVYLCRLQTKESLERADLQTSFLHVVYFSFQLRNFTPE
jgi:hypothetical protein